MPTVIRRKHTSRRQLGPYRRHELLFGEIFYPVSGYDGYGDGLNKDLAAFIDDNMKADWEANRDELMAFWASGEYTTSDVFPGSLPWLFDRGTPGKLPWAAKMFDAKMARRSPA
jgi:hypothetical protein